MAEAFVSEIRMYGFNFPPSGWAFCDGQLMLLSQNTALFSLLGTTYGGNGKTNFALPDLQGSVPVAAGQSEGTSEYFLGQVGGQPTVTLDLETIPAHTHTMMGSNATGDNPNPQDHALARYANVYQDDVSGLTQMAMQALTPVGAGNPHNNMMPYVGLNFCICLQGEFPQRG